LANAEVTLNGNSHYTGYDGQAIIAGLANGTYPYQVKKQGYFDATGSVQINNGYDSINVLMSELTFQNVEFFVKDNSNNPINNATLVYDNNTFTTDSNGYAITQSVTGGTYSYVLSAPGFLPDSGNITIGNNDTIIYFTLLVDTTYINEIYDDISIKLYPNPVEDILQISFENCISKFKMIEVISLSGQNIKSYKTSGQSFSIDMNGIKKGFYFIRICDDNNMIKTFKIIRN
jgi:hypothetical protein